MQSASRSTLSFRRWTSRALPALVAALVLVSQALAQAPAATSTVLTADTSSALSQKGDSVTLTAHVVSTAPATRNTQDAGSVTFFDTDNAGQMRELGSALVGEGNIATLTISSLPEGSHGVRAVFNGTQGALASTSATAQLTGQATSPDFTLGVVPSTLNLQAGVQGSVAVTISSVAGFSSYVSLSCAGLPLFTTCNFLPSNVSVGASGGQSTMTLNTVAASGNVTFLRRDTGLVYAFLLPGALGLAGLGLCRDRSLRTLAMLCVAGSLMLGAGSCAQRYTYLNRGPSPNPGTPEGNSIIRVFGTSVNGAEARVKCVQIALHVTSTNTSSGTNILTPCPAT